ncbi:MFS transporter [Isoptericola sp. NEAU-Y5]|uniref:MFS transporter n=1 Tax=Isoptericola luteus TaxID=2879484 RepID=A0ABS7ZF40_9MICO|nr:MFS transporter [Isoptericola sp. NEAU-Y5]MCA5892911.1 MFS transporter [Isoptericola sp. NEAU-Y5]
MTSRPRPADGREHGGGRAGWLLVALMLVALNLRAPITSVPPVADELSAGLGLSAAGVGMLTSVPVLCFAVCTPFASMLVARLGPQLSVAATLGGILAGTVVRSAGSVPAAFAGTVLIGVAITIGNLAVPVIIARDFRRRAAAVTSGYTAMMNVGSTFTTMLTVPLATAFGWQWALAGWGVLAAVGLAAWVPASRTLSAREAEAGRATSGPRRSGAQELAALDPATRARARRLAVLLSVAFAGQASGYYAVTAWLPEILQDRLGMGAAAAGGAAAPFQLCAVAGSFLVPMAFARGLSARTTAMGMAAMWLSLPLGLLLAPGLWLLWVGLAGAAQGGNFTVIFTLVAQRSPSLAVVRRSSAAIQTAGYACAALAPTALGAVQGATGGWTAPLLLITGALAVMTVAMWVASARPRH